MAWAAQQIIECCAWDRKPPRFLVHDRDSCYGVTFHRRVRNIAAWLGDLGVRLLLRPNDHVQYAVRVLRYPSLARGDLNGVRTWAIP
jgi:hypothetical protein